jgi:hypothetical protein
MISRSKNRENGSSSLRIEKPVLIWRGKRRMKRRRKRRRGGGGGGGRGEEEEGEEEEDLPEDPVHSQHQADLHARPIRQAARSADDWSDNSVKYIINVLLLYCVTAVVKLYVASNSKCQ